MSPFKLTHTAPIRVRTAVWRAIRRGREFLWRFRPSREIGGADATYSTTVPSSQNAVDVFKGTWASALPAQYRVNAGSLPTFDDGRVRWAEGVLLNGFRGLSILELGPYEAYNSWQFDQLGARSVTAIEANDLNFLKSLVVKEITGLHARLLHGDFTPYLETCGERYDLVWASGVLYHSSDPLRLIAAMARVTSAVFLHSHYFVEGAARSAHARSFFEPGRNSRARIGDREIVLHCRAYGQSKRGSFIGGAAPFSYWMERDDILAALRHAGFDEIQIGSDDPGNPNGPALFLLARRPDDSQGDSLHFSV